MRLLADESVDGPIVARLRRDGHEVLYVAEMAPGLSDDAVLDLANEEHCLLLTADKDFGDLVFRQHRLMWGIVLLRLAGQPSLLKSQVVSWATKKHENEMTGAFSVISRRVFRIRRAAPPAGQGC